MEKNNQDIHHQLDRITRRERGRLIADLVRRLGNHHLQLAEDVAQDAVLAALGTWPYQGMPDNPGAWLMRVAGNKAIDRLRRENREVNYQPDLDLRQVHGSVSDKTTHDPDIELMFLSCQPQLDDIDQLMLTLRIVCGFTARELATLFLITETSIAQRLSRSKRKLKQLDSLILSEISPQDLSNRLGSVHKVIYLLFSLGYSPRLGDRLIREDTAMEAVRLAQELIEHPLTNSPAGYALAALLFFQASRLKAREDASGKPVLLRDQNRKLWNKALIQKGFHCLQQSTQGETLSRYHIEAGIASLYASSKDWSSIDWSSIVRFYRQLQQLTDSPVVTINASVALAFSGKATQALNDLNNINRVEFIKNYAPYYIARAEVLQLLNRTKEAGDCYEQAIRCGVSRPVIEHLENRLANPS